MRVLGILGILAVMGAWSASGSTIYGFFIDAGGTGSITNEANPAGAPAPVYDVLTVVVPGLTADGVTFDATLTVTGFQDDGSPGPLDQTGDGVGVDRGLLLTSPITSDSHLVDDLEYLGFTMGVSNEIGGTVSFDGFTEVDFNFFSSDDTGVLSLDPDLATTIDNFFTKPSSPTGTAGDIDISSTLPASFFAIAGNGANDNTFRIDNVSAQFTGNFGATPVPEPGTYAMLGLLLAGVCGVRRFRRHA